MRQRTNYGPKNHLQGSYTIPARATKQGGGKGDHEEKTAIEG
jgi:hypothetical protein